ncbi:MAG TPA: SdiA-regulated domain-containing protein [Rhizobacter sp.]
MRPTPHTAKPRFLHAALALSVTLSLVACGGGDDDPAAPAPLAAPTLGFTAPDESLDLANYALSGRYTLPATSGATQIAAEVSAVTYNEATDSLFIVGDEGTYITQISKTGAVIDTMALPAGLFGDPEGITALGGGEFVVADERVRTANRFTYQGGTTLDAATVRTVKLGPTVGNVGLEGVSVDPLSGGFVFVKELTPKAIFQTTIDFNAGTASNGSPTTEPTNLFDPGLLDVADFGDVHALSATLPATAADRSHLVVLSNDTGRLLKVDRSGHVHGTLDLAQSAQHEGVTFDRELNLYVTNEAGGGSQDFPQLWVYTPTRSAAAVGLGSHLYLSFSADVTAGSGDITLVGSGGDTRSIAVTDTTQVRISGRTVKIDPVADLVPGTTYSIQYASGVFRGPGNVATQAVGNATTLAFTSVPDTTAPLLAASTPVDNATAIALGDNLVLSFNENVAAGTGTFTLSNGSDDVRSIAANDSTQVTINGNVVTINPAADLRAGAGYHLLVSANAVTDIAGNAFAGIADTTTLNFVTAGSTPPTTLAAGDLLFIAVNGDSPDAFAFILMRDIAPGTQIGFSDRDSLGATNEAAFMWTADQAYAAGTVVTVLTDAATPTADRGNIVGSGGGISTSSETVFAFQGSIVTTPAPALVVERYLAAINLGTAGPLDATLQAALNGAGAFIAFTPEDNVRYGGTLSIADPAALRASIANTANWVRNDTTAFPVTNGSLFP